MSVKRFLTGMTVATLAAGTWALIPAAAHADPGFAPDADDLVGVGSDTTEIAMNNVATLFNATNPTRRLATFDATQPGTGTVGDSIAIRPGVAIARPNGSGNGKKALYGASNVAGVDFARSSSALSTDEVNAGLYAFPFAKDVLVMAVRGAGSNAPASLTPAQIVSIYKGDTTDWSAVGGTAGTIKPLIPQSGSGTRSFFEAQLKAANGGVAVTLGAGVGVTQEHSDTDIKNDPNAIAPFSQGRGELLGTLRYESGFAAERPVYNVVRSASLNDADIQAMFGKDGFLCSTEATAAIKAGGLTQLATVSAGGVCGVAGQTAPTNLATERAATTTTVAGTSPAGGEAKLTATVASATPNPQGTVKFYLDGATTAAGTAVVQQGTATLSVKNLTPGQHSVTAAFKAGNGTAFADSSAAAATFVVRSASTTTLAVSDEKSVFGQSRSLVATVAAGSAAATGSVTFDVDGKKTTVALAGGKATLEMPKTTPAGSYAVEATYDGTAEVAPSSAKVTVEIGKAKVTLKSAKVTVKAGAAKKIALKVKAAGVKASGKVTLKVGKKVLAKGTVKKGKAKVKLPALPKGTVKVKVTFAGGANFGKAKATLTVTVK